MGSGAAGAEGMAGPGGRPWDRVAEALAWDGDTILAVGSSAEVLREARRAGAVVEDLGGRVVLPGFVDAHMHFLHAGLRLLRPDLRGAKSLEDCLGRLREWLAKHPGPEPVTGEGWDESGWPGRTRPTRGDLDAACAQAGQPGRPIVLRRIDGHIAVANSAALAILRRRWDDDALVDLDTGVLLEEASLYLNEALPASADTLDRALQEACRVAHRLGVTTVGDYSQAPFRAALQRAAARGTLSVRVASSVYVQQLDSEVQSGFRTGRRGLGPEDLMASHEGQAPSGAGPRDPPDKGARGGEHDRERSLRAGDGVIPGRDGGIRETGGTSPYLKDGGLKVFLDGSLGAHTAALRDGYLDGPGGKGKLNWTDSALREVFARAHAAGIQLHAHAIGDGAIDQGLAAFEEILAGGVGPGRKRGGPQAGETGTPGGRGVAQAEGQAQGSNGGPQAGQAGDGPNPLRHRFEHFEIAHDDQVERTAALGIVSSSQPNFVGEWSAKGGMYEARLGAAFRLNNRFQAMKRAGVRIAFGSDGMPFGPLVGLQAAVAHPMESERMDALEAVWHYTWMSAWSLHWEGLVGSLEAGKKADLVVLEETHLGSLPATWRIRETVVGGRSRHRRVREG